MTKTQSLIAIPAIAATLLMGGALAGYATLASAQTASPGGMMQGMRARAPHVHGTVTAVSGSTITVSDMRDNTSYTIDASAATFKKFTDGAAPISETIADIAVGDEVSAIGTLSGTSLKATDVIEGGMMGGRGGHGHRPGVMGTVTAVNGSTVTVKAQDGTSYTVQAGAATVQKMTTGSLSDIHVGDTIGVHGEVSGSTVTAHAIMDGVPAAPAQAQ